MSSRAALAFLRGRDADARLRELAAERAAARLVLAELAHPFLDRRLYEELGYRSLADWGRERVGVGARALREWARVWRHLRQLPRLRTAVLEGEVSWTVARLVVRCVSPEDDEACHETIRGRTVRAVRAILAHVESGEPDRAPEAEAGEGAEMVRLRASPQTCGKWHVAVELARRVAGEPLPVWACADVMAAEGSSALGADPLSVRSHEGAARARPGRSPDEHGLRSRVWPRLRWSRLRAELPARLRGLVRGVDGAGALEIEGRMRAIVAFLQGIDFEVGRILRQVVARRLHRELGFASFDRFVSERLDFSPRTARRMIQLSEAEQRAPAVGAAYRRGEVSDLQARVALRVADLESAARWVRRAKSVTLRRLEEDVDVEPRPVIAFRAPREVAAFFMGVIARAGSLDVLLDHVIRTWVLLGRSFRDYADFERDGYRCTVPGCTARRNLQSHHVVLRSAGGADAPSNRTTLCAFHHHRGVHAGRVSIRGRAPDELVYTFGGQWFGSGDAKLAPLASGGLLPSN